MRTYKEKYYRLRNRFYALASRRDTIQNEVNTAHAQYRALEKEKNSSDDEAELPVNVKSEDGHEEHVDIMEALKLSESDTNEPAATPNRFEYIRREFCPEKDTALLRVHVKRRRLSYFVKQAGQKTLGDSKGDAGTFASHASTAGHGGHVHASEGGMKAESMDEKPKKRRRARKWRDRRDAQEVQSLPVDVHGRIVLPVTVGRGIDAITIECLGTIVWDRDMYHTQRYIFPVGYRSTRLYLSVRNPKTRVRYTSEILDGGASPMFQVTADDLVDEPFIANSASGAWKKIIDRILQQGFSAKTHASGPQLYGLSDWGVMKAVQHHRGTTFHAAQS
ncbi:F/Y-rich N-terminus-domain-containing protein [Syncephalis pseudoplumigaleata]|uniref:F/Y-rich N-terminus-domain-containing protein n=1 Tax=Syncephalis pseudoplumigaleata TaxID=1712513 RepID=A0A4P9Z0N0_9FUNG|nr:F/Y-rich N-terminus-domain-containing protein [Syncephalis pseudoplumigaleata]|eukprot:RKP25825.1 F/Y-rich N-terminus-domain-containing protein [Syncephalis pseudoplumigaleata]